MSNNNKPRNLEKEREELIRLMAASIAPELQQQIDAAYSAIAQAEVPNVQVSKEGTTYAGKE
jgi:hypothetical protein